MSMQHRTILSAVLVLGWGAACSEFEGDLEACAGDPAVVDIEVTSPKPTMVPTAELNVRGTLAAGIRIRELRVGGIRATGLRDNFGDWEAKIPLDVLYAARVDRTSTLPVTAVDECDAVHEGPSFTVPAHAPAGTSADQLEISVSPGTKGGCYIPANGSARASLTLTAASGAAGVPVQLTPSKGIVSSASAVGAAMLVVLGGDGEEPATAKAELRVVDGKDDVVTVVAAAGGVSVVSPEIQVAGPPTVSSPAAAPERGQAYPLIVATAGRLAKCSADLSHEGAATVRYAKDDMDLSGGPVTIDQGEECGQKVVVEVVFAADAPDLAFVEVACEDVFGQRVRREVFLAIPEEESTTDP